MDFEKLFVTNSSSRELKVEYLTEKNYGAKVVFDSLAYVDFLYFDNLFTSRSDGTYEIYYADIGKKSSLIRSFSIEELYKNYISLLGYDRIIEFSGSDIFIYSDEIDYYVIFGNKENLKKIDDFHFSDRYATLRLEELNQTGTKYFQWLYDTYQHL